MKQNGATAAFLGPDAHGWRVSVGGAADQSVATLGDAIAALPADAHVELALPCQSVLIERHKLPSTDSAELADMLNLQLEKTLPYPIDDVSHGFEILSQDEKESTVLTFAASRAQLDTLCAPLREKGRIPGRITLQALRVAASCPESGTFLALWPEQEQTACAIVSEGKLAWAQPIPGLGPDAVLAELPGLLLSAELQGVPVDFSEIRIADEDAALRDALASHFGKPVQPLGALSAAKSALDLLPSSWQAEVRRRARTNSLKQNLLTAGVVWLVLVALAFGYLAWLKHKAQLALREHDAMKPRFAGIEKQMDRWNSLAPVLEPKRYAVEVLHQLVKALPGNENLHLTSFTFGPREWIAKGEATTDAKFEFVERLKKNKDLDAFDLQFPPEQPLKDIWYSFMVTGKPR
ncbi:MAG: hypothetical protein ABI318_04750 [Chthoniobacteraceae bacterium]